MYADLAALLARVTELVADSVGGESPDAASWSQEGTQRPEDSDMDGGRFQAVLIRRNGEIGFLALTAETATDKIAAVLGEQEITPMDLVTGVGFWRPGFAAPRTEVNVPATVAITRLVNDIVAGDYAVGDKDLARVKRLKRNNMADLTIHGPCVITGLSLTNRPAPMPERLKDWVNGLIVDVAYYQLGTEIAEQLKATGVPPHLVTGVMVKVSSD